MAQPVEAITDIIGYLKSDTELAAILGSQYYPLYESPERLVPYVIYDHKIMVTKNTYWLRRDMVLFRIHAERMAQAADITSRMLDLLGKDGDVQALASLNTWATASGSNAWSFKNCRFLNSDQLAPQEEGGLIRRYLQFEYLYTKKSGQA